MKQPAMKQKVCCAHAACFGSRTILGQGYRLLQILNVVHDSMGQNCTVARSLGRLTLGFSVEETIVQRLLI